MKKKKSSRPLSGSKRPRPAPAEAPPLTFEQLLEKKDLPATEPMPEPIQRQLSAPKFQFHSAGERLVDSGPYIQPDEGGTGYRLELPKGMQPGLPGRSGALMSTRELAKCQSLRGSASGYCPPWMERRFHSIPSLDDEDRYGVAADGTIITPHAGVFPPDDRRVYYPRYYPDCLVGKVIAMANGRTVGSGTGVLIGRRHVITAAHVCPWNAASWGILFYPGFYDGVALPGNGAWSWVSDFRALANVTAQDVARWNDLAMLRLYDPLGDALGYFGAKVYQPGWSSLTWRLNGYPSAVTSGGRPSEQRGISVVRTHSFGQGLELTHRGDATGGNSGSPLWHFWGDDVAYAIGIQSAGRVSATEDVNVAAGGVAMVNLINFWRNAWP